MNQIIDRVLAAPIVYDTYQSLIGAPSCHARFISEMVMPARGERVLDLGCGVGASIGFLPGEISYVGIDVSAPYIEAARAKYGERGTFICADVSSIELAKSGEFRSSLLIRRLASPFRCSRGACRRFGSAGG